MFAKDKVTQSMIDAVNSVISEKDDAKKSKGHKPDWLIAAEKKAEAKEGKLPVEEGLADDFLKVARSEEHTSELQSH